MSKPNPVGDPSIRPTGAATHVIRAGTMVAHAPEAVRRRRAPWNRKMSVTLVMRPPAAWSELAATHMARRQARPLHPREVAERFPISNEQLAAVRRFAAAHGLEVVDVQHVGWQVVLRGSVAAFERAFHVRLRDFDLVDTRYVCHEQDISVPLELDAEVVAVLGLDARPLGRRGRIRGDGQLSTPQATGATVSAPSGAGPPYLIPDVAAAYGFDAALTGAGTRVALLEFGGGYVPSVMASYFQAVLHRAGPALSDEPVGATNRPGTDVASTEVVLDIQVVGSIVPDADVVVVFAPNTITGWANALTACLSQLDPVPDVISISWVAPEAAWGSSGRASFEQGLATAAALGVTVTAAAGDAGVDPAHASPGMRVSVSYPASSTAVLACGGTRLTLASDGTSGIASETVWQQSGTNGKATGGGISDTIAQPSWQSGVTLPTSLNGAGPARRGLPDVAGSADPARGYQVLGNDGAWISGGEGGTSAVAPLWAALVCQVNQSAGARLGYFNADLYAIAPTGFRDITSGNNSAGTTTGYSATTGWDACTGWGSPDVGTLVPALVARIQS